MRMSYCHPRRNFDAGAHLRYPRSAEYLRARKNQILIGYQIAYERAKEFVRAA